ncbi:MAG: endonuclease [Phycisphaeraceae bacterium]|nr:endonuclease [Phycisphaeraceae bacterium]
MCDFPRSRVVRLLLCASISLLCSAPGGAAETGPAASEDDIAVFFSPRGGAADAVIALINDAKRSVRVESFMFTNHAVRDALIAAHRRGVEVEVVLDHHNSRIKGSARRALRRAGITVYVTPAEIRMHSKVLIIDDDVIVTGSFNLTWAADRSNVEDVLILRGRRKITRAYLERHRKLRAISKKYATKRRR